MEHDSLQYPKDYSLTMWEWITVALLTEDEDEMPVFHLIDLKEDIKKFRDESPPVLRNKAVVAFNLMMNHVAGPSDKPSIMFEGSYKEVEKITSILMEGTPTLHKAFLLWVYG